MQRGFIKAIFAVVVFTIGFVFLSAVVATTFGILESKQDSFGNRYFILNTGRSDIKVITCWIDLPKEDYPRCMSSR